MIEILAAVAISALQLAVILLVREPWRRALAESELRRKELYEARDDARDALERARAEAQRAIRAAQDAATHAVDSLAELTEWPARPGVAGLVGPIRGELFRAAGAVDTAIDGATRAVSLATATARDTAAAPGAVRARARRLLGLALGGGRVGVDPRRDDLDSAGASGARELHGGNVNVDATSPSGSAEHPREGR